MRLQQDVMEQQHDFCRGRLFPEFRLKGHQI
ncbi:Uncharacterised protein [Vibrio cholerae]|nr:Uncharacterised protein [Vibrio cholerae]